MNTNNGKTGNVNIPGALHSTGGDGDGQVGGVVAYAGDIYDETLQKNQKDINESTITNAEYDSNTNRINFKNAAGTIKKYIDTSNFSTNLELDRTHFEQINHLYKSFKSANIYPSNETITDENENKSYRLIISFESQYLTSNPEINLEDIVQLEVTKNGQSVNASTFIQNNVVDIRKYIKTNTEAEEEAEENEQEYEWTELPFDSSYHSINDGCYIWIFNPSESGYHVKIKPLRSIQIVGTYSNTYIRIDYDYNHNFGQSSNDDLYMTWEFCEEPDRPNGYLDIGAPYKSPISINDVIENVPIKSENIIGLPRFKNDPNDYAKANVILDPISNYNTVTTAGDPSGHVVLGKGNTIIEQQMGDVKVIGNNNILTASGGTVVFGNNNNDHGLSSKPNTYSVIIGTQNEMCSTQGSVIIGYNNDLFEQGNTVVSSNPNIGNIIGSSNTVLSLYYNVFGKNNNVTEATFTDFNPTSSDITKYRIGNVVGNNNTISGGLDNNVYGSKNTLQTSNKTIVLGQDDVTCASESIIIGKNNNSNLSTTQGNYISNIINIGNNNKTSFGNTIVIGHNNESIYSNNNAINPVIIFGQNIKTYTEDYNINSIPLSELKFKYTFGEDLSDVFGFYKKDLYYNNAFVTGSYNYNRTFSLVGNGLFEIGSGNSNEKESALAFTQDGNLYLKGMGNWDGKHVIDPNWNKSINEIIKPLENLNLSESEKFYNYMQLPSVDIFVHSIRGANGYDALEIYTNSDIELFNVATIYIKPSGIIANTINLEILDSQFISNDRTFNSNITKSCPRYFEFKNSGNVIYQSDKYNNEKLISNSYFLNTSFYLKGLLRPRKFVLDKNNNVYRANWHNLEIIRNSETNMVEYAKMPMNYIDGTTSVYPYFPLEMDTETNKPINC